MTSQDDISPELRQKLLETLRLSVTESSVSRGEPVHEEEVDPVYELAENEEGHEEGHVESPYAILHDENTILLEPPLSVELQETAERLQKQLSEVQKVSEQGSTPSQMHTNLEIGGTLSVESSGDTAQTDSEETGPVGNRAFTQSEPEARTLRAVSLTKKDISGGPMADLSGYKDLSKAPISLDDDQDMPMHTMTSSPAAQMPSADFRLGGGEVGTPVDTEFSGNVKKLIQLVNDLPDSVTRQDGASVIRLTMEAMGVAMEDVLSEAQSAQSEMLDAVRANIKKIEEYKTVIRKLETDIKYYQGKANELSEIIDLFILSNTSGQNMPQLND